MSNAETTEIKKYGMELSSISKKLEDILNQIELDYQRIEEAISTLRSYNGMASRWQLLPIKVPKWNIYIDDSELTDVKRSIKNLKEGIEALDLSGEDLITMGAIINNFINIIEEQFDKPYKNYDGLNDYFQHITHDSSVNEDINKRNTAIWDEYKEISKLSKYLKSNDLLYLKYRSTTGEDDYVDFLLDEIGNHRLNSDSNHTKYAHWYTEKYPNSGMTNEAAFCAATVTYVFENSGNKGVIKPYIGVYNGSVEAKELAANGIGEWHSAGSGYQPKRGDIFYKGGDHTGIVLASDENYIYTVEGNTSSDQGEKGNVNTRIRSKDYISSGGYYTPNCYINYDSNNEDIQLTSEYIYNKQNGISKSYV